MPYGTCRVSYRYFVDWGKVGIDSPMKADDKWIRQTREKRLCFLFEWGNSLVDKVAVGQKRATIGQCFPPTMCRDGVPQIFISPRIADSIDVLGTLLHELVHAAVGCQFGHRKEFSQAARRMGLEGPPTATVVGKELRPLLQAYVDRGGPYPHAAIIPRRKEEKPGSRLRLYECCCEPPVKVRVASNDFQAVCAHCEQMFTLVVQSS